MIWLLCTLAAAFLWASVNVLDKVLIEKIAINRSVGSLILFSSLIGVPFALISFFLSKQVWVGLNSTLLMVLAGCLYLTGLTAYLWALAYNDTSVVAPQLLMVPLFSLVLASTFLEESLSARQWVGGGFILLGAVILGWQAGTAIFNFVPKVFGLMVLCSLFFALDSFVIKYSVVNKMEFWTALFWHHIGFVVFGTLIWVWVPSYRRDFLVLFKQKGLNVLSINILNEVLSGFGNLAFSYATLLAPLALTHIVAEGIQPFIVLALTTILSLKFPHILLEDVTRQAIVRRGLATLIICFGLVLLSW
jgi:uncharacterized membrane protein